MTTVEKLLNNGFTREQAEEISKGQEAGINIAIYLNKEFLPIQMRQIRLGLIEQLPAAVYAKVEFDWFQMEEIRKGLKSGVDIEIYAKPEIPYEKMRQIRKGLEEGIDLSEYLEKNAGIIREIREARRANLNISKYIEEGYDANQLNEIRGALEKGINLDPYLCKEYRAASIAEIRKGLEAGIDASMYAMIHYSWRQMREIRVGLEHRVDVAKYSSQMYSWEQMKEIRLGLEKGLNVDTYRRLRYTAGEMRKRRQAILAGVYGMPAAAADSRKGSEECKIEVSSDNMEAYITLLVQNKPIEKEKLLKILENSGICKGIQADAVEKIAKGKYGKEAFLIARGQSPEKGEDGWYEFFFRTDIQKKPKILEDGSVDYQNIEWFEMVKEGQKLAFYHEAKEGTDGYDVSGTAIKARRGAEKSILKGKGFRLEQDKKTYTAVMNGMIQLNDDEMWITNHLVLDEINMATGNIKFDGSIHILGDVGHGVVISATEDVVIDGSVEAATIESGGNIILKKGMNSAGHGLINAEKDVVSRFFEATKVMAKGNIEVDKCLNSQLYAGGTITSTRVIAGGVAQAEKGFRVNNVGNLAGIHTVLKLKVNAKVWEERRMLFSAIKDVKHELQMLNNSYEEFKVKFPPEIRNNMDIFKKLEKAVFTKNKQLEQLMKLREENEQSISKTREAKVVIAGCAHEGTALEMNENRWLAQNQHNITVRQQNEQMEVVTN